MSNREHVAVILEGADALAQWLNLHAEAILNLEGADLAGIDLRGAQLRHANLKGANLTSERRYPAPSWPGPTYTKQT